MSANYPVFIDFYEAQRFVVEQASMRRLPVEKVSLADAVGRMNQAPIVAKENHPPFDKSAMDGFAIICDDMKIGDEFVIIGESQAGAPYTGKPISKGEAVRISTGAVMPKGANAVIPVEDTEEKDGRFVAKAVVGKFRNIAPEGEDCKQSDVLLDAGTVVSPFAVSALASEGVDSVWVRKRPTVAVITTGDEIISDSSNLTLGQIRNMNAPAIKSWLHVANAMLVFEEHVIDSQNDLKDVISKALDSADVILLSGGVSAGVHDLVPSVVESLGGKIHFHKVRQKPGKPLLFATFGDKLFFGLPGNPVSSLVMMHVYVIPTLRILQELPYRRMMHRATIAEDVSFKGDRYRLELANVYISKNGLQIKLLQGAGSADVFKRVRANAFVALPVSVEELKVGEEVAFEFLAGLEDWL